MTSDEWLRDLGPLPVVREEADDELIKILQPVIQEALTDTDKPPVPFTAYDEKWFVVATDTSETHASFSLWCGEINGPLNVNMTVTRSADHPHQVIVEGEIRCRRSEYPSYYPKKFPVVNKLGCSIAWAWIEK